MGMLNNCWPRTMAGQDSEASRENCKFCDKTLHKCWRSVDKHREEWFFLNSSQSVHLNPEKSFCKMHQIDAGISPEMMTQRPFFALWERVEWAGAELNLIVVFDTLEPPAFNKCSIRWVFQTFSCWNQFYQVFSHFIYSSFKSSSATRYCKLCALMLL